MAASFPEDDERALETLAERYGVTRSYYDGIGQLRRASDEALLAVLRSLGAPLESGADAVDALHSPQPEPARIVCLEASAPAALRLERDTRAVLALETGEHLLLDIERRDDAFYALLPRDLPAGYHCLEEEADAELRCSSLLVAPSRLPEAARGWGLFAPLYGLRRNESFASYGDLARLSAWMGEAGSEARPQMLLGTLPLLACFFEEPFEPSPYSPISRFFWSELYVDPSLAPEAAALPRELFRVDAGASDTRRLPYREAMRQRRAGIEASLHALDAEHGRRREAFESELEEDEELARYAAFRASVERKDSTWQLWSVRAREGLLRAGVDYDGEAYRYHAYAQWLAREQIADAAKRSEAGLYLDLPLGSHGGGYDCWRYRSDFAEGSSAGAPPDAVFEGGQNWAFPPMHPLEARRSLYAPLRAALRHHFRHAALLRIDHVMSLHRLFWIADGFTAADGVYVRYRPEELWSVVAIEAARARDGRGAAVAGEDLGTVPDEVRAELARRGALRMHVVPFQCRHDEAQALDRPNDCSLASLGTHDMESFASWWKAEGTPRREIARQLGCSEDAGDALEALLAWLSASEARVVCANLEDLWLEEERQNLPGSPSGETNWQRSFALGFEELCRDAQVARRLAALRGKVATSRPRESDADGTEARP